MTRETPAPRGGRAADNLFCNNLYVEALEEEADPGQLPLFFSSDVLDRYRERDGFSVMRTDSAGRVKKTRVWSLDFGIAAGDGLIHTAAATFLQQVPERERSYWVAHLVTLPLSDTFLQMQSRGGGSCIDDGELRSWD